MHCTKETLKKSANKLRTSWRPVLENISSKTDMLSKSIPHIIFSKRKTHHLMLGSKHCVTGHTTQAGEGQAELQEQTSNFRRKILVITHLGL
jgi:hypothetical protein